MSDNIISMSDARLIRRAPENVIAIDEDDIAYLQSSVDAITDAFGVAPFRGAPVETLPALLLMRTLVAWWRHLRPASEAQQAAHAIVPSAILLLDNACSCEAERAAARHA